MKHDRRKVEAEVVAEAVVGKAEAAADAADKAAEQLREIRLPEKMHAYGVTRISLEQVTFGDGTFWMPMGRSNCSLNVGGSSERISH